MVRLTPHMWQDTCQPYHTLYGHVCTSHYFCGTQVLWSSSEYGGWLSSLTSPQHTWQLLRAARQALDLLRGTSAGHTETIYVCV